MIEKMVDIGGYKLFMREIGSGEITVIFESAMGNTLKSWLSVQRKISEMTHTIAYDRAGNGKSEKSPYPRTCLTMAKELHELLRRSEIKPPYIFVGASYGAYIIRTYAHLYPGQLAGIVLVEPSHEDYFDEIKKTRSEDEWLELKKMTDYLALRSPGSYKEEWDSFSLDSNYVRELVFPKLIPIIVITSARFGVVEKKIMKLKQEDINMRCYLHSLWASNYSNIYQIITKKSGHDILMEEQELVISTVLRVIKEIGINQGFDSDR